MDLTRLDRLQQSLGYCFTDAALCRLALSHCSFSVDNNERLEFLGDAILNFVIAEALYQRFAGAREGELSRLRASLVNESTLARLAVELGVGGCLLLGDGEQKSGGRARRSILADALEAIIGAIYLDGGLERCRERVLAWFAGRIDGLGVGESAKDAKTRLQEWLQARREPLPEYRLDGVEGRAHEQWFSVSCRVRLLAQPGRGGGRSRRAAEQQAAAAVLQTLQSELSA